jgi:hypothetical protein
VLGAGGAFGVEVVATGGFTTGGFTTGGFATGGFATGALLTGVFLTGGFFAGAVVAVVAGDFAAAAFVVVVSAAAFVAGFVSAGFFAAGLFTAGFLAAGFFAAGFFAAGLAGAVLVADALVATADPVESAESVGFADAILRTGALRAAGLRAGVFSASEDGESGSAVTARGSRSSASESTCQPYQRGRAASASDAAPSQIGHKNDEFSLCPEAPGNVECAQRGVVRTTMR